MSNQNVKDSLDIKLTVSKNMNSTSIGESQDTPAQSQKKGKGSKGSSKDVNASQEAKMNITKSELERNLRDDHFEREGDAQEIQYELVNPDENEKLIVRKFE
jgi:hypothetical protein